MTESGKLRRTNVAQHLKIYIEYPPRQRRGTLALDQVLAKLQEADAAMN